MTYVINTDGTITIVKNKADVAKAKEDWADYAKDLNKSENS